MPKKIYMQREIPIFIQKLWDILANTQYHDILSWNNNGKSFVILNIPLLQRKVLPIYYRHTNLKSFVRQLNMYHFKKYQRDRHSLIFHNTNFQQNQYQKLHLIQRKINRKQKTKSSLEGQYIDLIQDQDFNDFQSEKSSSKNRLSIDISTQTERNVQKLQEIKSFGRLILSNQNLVPFVSPYSLPSIKSINISENSQQNNFEKLWEYQVISNRSREEKNVWGSGVTSFQHFI